MGEVVRKANALVSAAHRLSTAEQRVIWCAISKIEPMCEVSDEVLYKVSAADLVNAGVSSKGASDVLHNAIDQLFKRSVTLMATDGKEITTRWVQSIRDHSKTGDSYIELRFSKDLLPYLSNLSAQFTQYSLRDAVSLGSAHAGRIFELLMQYKSVGHRTIELTDLRYMLELTKKYPAFSDFRKRVLDKSVELIECNTSMRVNYETIRQGRKISHIKFNFYYPQKATLPAPEPAIDEPAAAVPPADDLRGLKGLAPAQAAFFASKLTKHGPFSHITPQGKSESEVIQWLSVELQKDDRANEWGKYLKAVGFSLTKPKA